MSTYPYVRGDTLPKIPCRYEQEDDNGNVMPIDITGFTFELAFVKKVNNVNVTVLKTATIDDPTHGLFSFAFEAGDLDTVGKYPVRITLIMPDQNRQSWQDLTIAVLQDIAPPP